MLTPALALLLLWPAAAHAGRGDCYSPHGKIYELSADDHARAFSQENQNACLDWAQKSLEDYKELKDSPAGPDFGAKEKLLAAEVHDSLTALDRLDPDPGADPPGVVRSPEEQQLNGRIGDLRAPFDAYIDYALKTYQEANAGGEGTSSSIKESKRKDTSTTQTDPTVTEKALPPGGGTPAQRTDLGDQYAAQGDLTGALRNYEQSVKLNPDNPAAYSKLAQIKLQQGDLEGAIADARKSLTLDPNNQLAQFIAGHADSLGRGADRIKGRKLDFGSADPGAGLSAASGGSAASLHASPSNSYRQSPSAAAAGPLRAYFLRIEEKLRINDLTGALMAASQAIDADPKSADAYALRAEVLIKLGKYAAALKDAEQALKLDPANARALRSKAYAELQLGDYHQAYEDALRATQLEPAIGLGFLYLAMAEEKLGMNAEALKSYEAAIALDPALEPLAQESVRRLSGAGAASQSGRPWGAPLVRGGAVAAALAFILFGVLGAGGRKVMTTSKESETPTVLDSRPKEVTAGTMLGGNYRVSGELGRGGMGVVYEATDETLQRRVAIKQLQRGEHTTSEDLERLLQEARLVARLKHPHLAEIYNVIKEDDLFLVFEFVDGQPLDKILSLNGKLPAAASRKLVADVASALDYAHSQKIIHRDLKPSNIMVTKAGSAKVMDFGIAHQSQAATALTRTGASGTPPYMAPEQAMGSVSKASDLYALGVMTYEMLTGVRPFAGPDFLEQKLRCVYAPASQRDPALPRGLDAFFATALDPDPTKRPASADEFLQALNRAAPL